MYTLKKIQHMAAAVSGAIVILIASCKRKIQERLIIHQATSK